MGGVVVPARIEVGSGPAVLLIHGLNGFKEGWGPLPERLAARGLRVVAVDLPGFGATARLAGRTTPSGLAAALAPLVRELAPVGLVGHSLGTQVAMLAARAAPDAVRALALVSPWVEARPRRFPPRAVSDLVQIPMVGPALARLAIARMRRSPERRRDAYLTAVADPRALTGDPAMAALLAEASDRLAEADLRAVTGWAASALALDVRPEAPRLTAPTLVVWGEEDRITRAAGARRLAAALPAGTALALAGVGHFPHLESPGPVADAIAEHLA